PEHRAQTLLNTWQDVASYLGVSVRTAQTYEKTMGLPVRRMPGRRGRIIADPAELDRWRLQAVLPSARPPETASRSKARLLIFLGLVAGAVALLLILLIQLRSGPTPSLLLAQITHSGFRKFAPIVTDGKQLFFTEQENDRYWISTVPIGGGETREFHTAISNPYVSAISPDRKSLLARSVGKDFNERAPFFIQPLDGSPPAPLHVLVFDGSLARSSDLLGAGGDQEEIACPELQRQRLEVVLKSRLFGTPLSRNPSFWDAFKT